MPKVIRNLHYPDPRRQILLAKPCWNAYNGPDSIENLWNISIAANESNYKEIPYGNISYIKVAAPQIGESEAKEERFKIHFTRTGNNILINNKNHFASYYNAGIISDAFRGTCTFSSLPINYANSLYNFLMSSCGDHILYLDGHKGYCRALAYTRNDISKNANFRGEFAEINIDYIFWELKNNAKFNT